MHDRARGDLEPNVVVTSVGESNFLRANDKPVALRFLIEMEFRSVGFCRRRKPENSEKNPQSREENQQQTQPT